MTEYIHLAVKAFRVVFGVYFGRTSLYTGYNVPKRFRSFLVIFY